MFWNKTTREARRQVVLDELIDMDPDRRRRRLELAVAEGDVRANEVDEALRMVSRLDAVRIMDIAGTRGGASSESESSSGDAIGAGPVPQSKPRLQRRQESRRRGRASRIPQEFAAGAQSPEKIAALRRANRALGTRPRRSRLATVVGIEVPPPAEPKESEATSVATAPDAAIGSSAPDISWLRP